MQSTQSKMSKKLVLLLLGTVLLSARILADTTEAAKDNTTERELNERNLINDVIKRFNIHLDDAITAIRKYYEPIIKDVQSKKITVHARAEEVLNDLVKVLENATEYNTSINEKKYNLKEAVRKCILMEVLQRELSPDATTDGDVALQKATADFKSELFKLSEVFANDAFASVEKYWNSLNDVQKQAEQTLGDKINKSKNDHNSTAKKLQLLEDLFDFDEDAARNRLAIMKYRQNVSK